MTLRLALTYPRTLPRNGKCSGAAVQVLMPTVLLVVDVDLRIRSCWWWCSLLRPCSACVLSCGVGDESVARCAVGAGGVVGGAMS